MKKWLYAPGLGLVMLASAGLHAADKIAVVNIASIFQQLPERETIAKQIENDFKGRAGELQNMEESIKNKMKHLQRDGATMKSSDRSHLEKELIIQREKFAHQAQDFEEAHHRRQIEERNKILSRIQDAVKCFAKKEGYDIVIDANTVAYMNVSKEITADVLKQVK